MARGSTQDHLYRFARSKTTTGQLLENEAFTSTTVYTDFTDHPIKFSGAVDVEYASNG